MSQEKTATEFSPETFESALQQLTRHSRTSLYLTLVGACFLAGSVYYAATRLRPLEEEINVKRAEIARLAEEEAAQKQRVAALQQQYETLRTNTEKLYAVKVTPANQVYELKATAQATGDKYPNGRPIYDFNVYVNSPPGTLESIRRVVYRFDHDTFRQKEYVAERRGDKFSVGYRGWGCLTNVDVTVELEDGSRHEMDFNMCRSLGPNWS